MDDDDDKVLHVLFIFNFFKFFSLLAPKQFRLGHMG
jgi:hypothetical protein